MDCINCAAPLPPKTTRCPFCDTLNDIDLRGRLVLRRGASGRDCPRCSKKRLSAVVLQVGSAPVEIDRCLECHGLFFDPTELDSVLDGLETRAHTVDHRQLLTLVEKETPTEDFEQVTYVPCPDCGQLMHRRSFGQQSGVIVDCCREHGVWLDGGELRRLIRWTQAGGRRHDAARGEEKKRLEADLRKSSSPVPLPTLAETGSGGGSLRDKAAKAFDVADLLLEVVDLFRRPR